MQCPLCQSQETSDTKGFFDRCFRCSHCGFVFAEHREDDSDSGRYDNNWAVAEVHPTFIYHNGEFLPRNQALWDRLLQKVEPYRRLNRLLDVGCSAAFFRPRAD
jgi:hypothetical protein